MTDIPFSLSLSKGLPSHSRREGKGFDKLSPNGSCAPVLEETDAV
jgi:hypothetical protein